MDIDIIYTSCELPEDFLKNPKSNIICIGKLNNYKTTIGGFTIPYDIKNNLLNNDETLSFVSSL